MVVMSTARTSWRTSGSTRVSESTTPRRINRAVPPRRGGGAESSGQKRLAFLTKSACVVHACAQHFVVLCAVLCCPVQREAQEQKRRESPGDKSGLAGAQREGQSRHHVSERSSADMCYDMRTHNRGGCSSPTRSLLLGWCCNKNATVATARPRCLSSGPTYGVNRCGAPIAASALNLVGLAGRMCATRYIFSASSFVVCVLFGWIRSACLWSKPSVR